MKHDILLYLPFILSFGLDLAAVYYSSPTVISDFPFKVVVSDLRVLPPGMMLMAGNGS